MPPVSALILLLTTKIAIMTIFVPLVSHIPTVADFSTRYKGCSG